MGLGNLPAPTRNSICFSQQHFNYSDTGAKIMKSLMDAFSIPEREGILWNASNERKYRFNRKDGGIYIDLVTNLKKVGSSLDMLILQHFQFSAALFNMPHQDWVMLAFIDPDDVVSIGYLNSGSTDATRAWDAYALNLQTEGIPLVVNHTKIDR